MESQESVNKYTKEWIPGHYFGRIPLSMTEGDLIQLLGEPDEIEKDLGNETDYTINYWYGEPYGFYVSFEYYDGDKKGELNISGYEVYLLGKPLHELSFEDLLRYLQSIPIQLFQALFFPFQPLHKDHNYMAFEYKEKQINEESIEYYFPHLGVAFWFLDGEMSDFNISLPEYFHRSPYSGDLTR